MVFETPDRAHPLSGITRSRSNRLLGSASDPAGCCSISVKSRLKGADYGVCVFTGSVIFLGSDDFPKQAKTAAMLDLSAALKAGWPAFEIAERIPLSEIAHAHELAEHPARSGRIVVTLCLSVDCVIHVTPN